MTPSLSEIERLEGLARAATPGPWEHDNDYAIIAGEYEIASVCSINNDYPVDTLAFIAAANPQTILSLTQALRESAWRPIAEHDGSDAPVDLWQCGKRLTDYRLVNGRWEKKHGYPTTTNVLMTKPTHFMRSPGTPDSTALRTGGGE